MALPGRKSSDFGCSISKGSAADFDNKCEPCLAIGQQMEAHGFCVDCQKYLCKSCFCFAYHQRIKTTKYHQLLDKESIGKLTMQRKDSVMCTEKCKPWARTCTQYRFERSKDLENAMPRQERFGKLSDPTSLVTANKKKTIDKLTYKDDINVRTKSDKNNCDITGCAVLFSHKIVLADENNCKLKVVDRQSKVVIEEKSLGSGPRDIAVLPQDQIAVTMPRSREIYIMSTASKFSNIRKVAVTGQSRGITYHQDRLYVLCWDPASVGILDIHGNVQITISLNNEVFSCPNYIVFNEDSRLIYISNFLTHNVVSVTLQNDVYTVYKNKDVKRPVGMVMLEDGSLLVCCSNTGIIHRISEDLKQGETMIDRLTYPQSICYSRDQQEVYIGCKNLLQVFSLQ